MDNVKIKKITILILVIILIICCSIYVFKNIELKNNKDYVVKLNYNSEVKEELLTLIKNELSSGWHRYYDWEDKIDNNPYIVCSGKNKIVASIRHEDYGDIYFVFNKIEDKYYIKEYGNKITDWQTYCG